MKNLARLLMGSILLWSVSVLAVEEVYVTDVLQLALHEQEQRGGKLLRNLPSGTPLTLLERKGNYARVRTEDGVEGWTKALFLVTEKPTRFQLKEAEARNRELQSQLEALRQKLDAARTAPARLEKELEQVRARAARDSGEITGLQAQIGKLRQAAEQREHLIPVKWALVAVIVSLLLGFIAGISWFDYRSRKRHGGYRIY